jgi:sugar phosphate isomerase/epimerase
MEVSIMARKISRRQMLAAGALTAGAGALTGESVPNVSAQSAATQKPRAGLPDVWGQDFLMQWSPPANAKRNLTPGSQIIRLSSPRIPNREGTDYASVFKAMRAGGWTACECGSSEWVGRKLSESEIREIKAQLKANDIVFYGLHCAGNIIAPDPDADRWQRHIVDTIHAAEEMGCQLILTHSGSMYPNRNTPHPLNWSREGWNRSVNALKRICKDTAGSKIEIAIEDVNSEAVNCPEAHVRLRQDVGDPRIMAGLDVTNMVHPGVVFRMTELIDKCFDLLADQIAYVHTKDLVWNGMLPGINWAMNGTGCMDYETFLVRMSKLKRPTNALIEFLNTPEELTQAQKNVRDIAAKVGVKIYGSQA